MKSEDMLLLMDNLMFKKKHSELFEISYNDKKLFKDIRNN